MIISQEIKKARAFLKKIVSEAKNIGRTVKKRDRHIYAELYVLDKNAQGEYD